MEADAFADKYAPGIAPAVREVNAGTEESLTDLGEGKIAMAATGFVLSRIGGRILTRWLGRLEDKLDDVLTDVAPNRLPQDLRVSSTPPAALPTDRPIGLSPTQNAAAQSRIRELEAQGYTDIRVNQQQVNALGQRCGVCRPDIQATSPTGQRAYFELDRTTSNRGPVHERRLRANDPDGTVELIRSD